MAMVRSGVEKGDSEDKKAEMKARNPKFETPAPAGRQVRTGILIFGFYILLINLGSLKSAAEIPINHLPPAVGVERSPTTSCLLPSAA